MSESINVVNSVKIDNLQNDLKKEKKITRSLRAKVDSLHRRKAIDILSVKKDNKYLQHKLKEIKSENEYYKAKARDYLQRMDEILSCVKMDLEFRRKNKYYE